LNFDINSSCIDVILLQLSIIFIFILILKENNLIYRELIVNVIIYFSALFSPAPSSARLFDRFSNTSLRKKLKKLFDEIYILE